MVTMLSGADAPMGDGCAGGTMKLPVPQGERK
jgi:hypothetical protein